MTQVVIANMTLAAVYFISGLSTLTLSLLPNGATPLWPPTGIALAAVLIWGYRLLPAVFMGDFLVGYYLLGFETTTALALCCLIGFQALLQAASGRWLLERFGIWPSELTDGKTIFHFFFVAAVISTLFPAVLMILGQYYFGVLESTNLIDPVLMWWIGSALGVVIFTPIILILFASPQRVWRTRIVGFVVPMLLSFITLVFVLHGARDNELAQVADRFKDNVTLAHSVVERRFDQHVSSLRNMRAFFQNSEFVTQQEFDAYLDDFSDSADNQLQHIGWAQRVLANKREWYESHYGYDITEFEMAEQRMVQAGKRPFYYAVRYVQSEQAMPSEFGFEWRGADICENKLREHICGRMIETGQAQLVTQINHPDKALTDRQFLYALPVLSGEKEIKGIVFQLLEYRALVEDFLTSEAKQWLDVEITDLATGIVLFSSDKGDGNQLMKVDHIIDVAGQQWQFSYQPSAYFIETYSSRMPYWLMTGAFLIFSLIAIWLMTLTGITQQVKREVKDKTREIAHNAQLLEESESKYRCLVESIQDQYLIYSYDKTGMYTYISPSVKQILGYEQLDYLKHYSTYLIESELNEKVADKVAAALAGEPAHYEMEVRTKSGETHTLSVHENPVFEDGTRNVVSVEGIARDITESKKVQQALEKLSLAMKHSPNAVVITDREGNIEYVNPKFTTITGYSANEAIGKWPDIISSDDTDPEMYKDLWETLLSGLEWRGELKSRKKNGDFYWAQEVIAPMLDEAGEVTHFVVTQEDITEARQLNEQTSYQASHDLLTGLMNRHEFEARLQRAIAASKRDLTEHALCYLDLDRFKIVNDTCGHVAGDELLRQVGALMSSNVRSRDTLARLGGDEFALLMEHCGIEQAHQACEQLITLFQNFRFHWEGHVFTIGVSIGLAIIDQHIKDNDEAMKNADSACYEAKDNGRNQVKVHIEDHARLQKRRGEIQWSSEISDALDNDRLLLYAQPIVALQDTAHCVGYEVLLRMRMADGRIVPPGAFLPAAERYNSASRIDRWVVNHTLHWMNKHIGALSHVKSISINLSGQSLDDEAMTEYIIREFERGDIPADKIKFEITETAAIANLHEATQFINTLREFGCRFALDDFGSGLSSFAYLKNLNVDTLKIDGMFIKDMLEDTLDYEMVKSINEIGHVMGLETVAEFVESEAIMEKLREIGVDYAQGYSLGKPVSLYDIIET